MTQRDGSNSPIRRSRGDDVVIEVRVRRSAYEQLAGDGIPIPQGHMQLVPEGDGTHGICIWSNEIPNWREPVPGNAASAAELEARDVE